MIAGIHGCSKSEKDSGSIRPEDIERKDTQGHDCKGRWDQQRNPGEVFNSISRKGEMVCAVVIEVLSKEL